MTVSQHVNARTVWISDVHLGFKDCKVDYLYKFLSSVQCDTLYLVGDIVDLWSLKKRIYWPQEHYHILLKLYELPDKGTRVIYIPGNHDDPMRRFAGQKFGPIEIAIEHEYTSVSGKKYWILHGDAVDAYMKYDWLKRMTGDAAYNLLLFINRWGNRFRRLAGMPYFSLAGQIKDNIHGARAAIERYKKQVIREAKKRHYDGVICGHIHRADLDTSDNFVYANTGDWIESCTALTEDYAGNLHLLHCVDRVELKASDRGVLEGNDGELDAA
ncbi:UDP-2,3-diacylglucosamine diphosphatase [Teredinibacter turnerae]|uniref:UDP-2,3-diacylglucosamine diphosphatase n=1 Tax=Teredinibacter turnerae TaxID=2426 RepID=UPI000379F292|nr:UDP-2,3-diacylglucosamine diphosphatase [Teredinibacter turnerae]